MKILRKENLGAPLFGDVLPEPAAPPGGATESDPAGGIANPNLFYAQGVHVVEPAPPLGSSVGRDVFAGGSTDTDATRQVERGGRR